MALTSQEEALIRQLLDQQAAILSLAGNEATITSKLGTTKVTLSDLTTASSLNDTDLFLTRQGLNDKSVTARVLRDTLQTFIQDGTGAVTRSMNDKLKESITVSDFGADPNGVVDSSLAVSRMANEYGFVVFPIGNFLLRTMAIGVPVFFDAGAYISVPAGQTLTITSIIESPRQWIFRGDGAYSLGHDADSGENARMVHASWFGAFPSPYYVGMPDQAPAINKAFASMGNARESIVQFDVGNYMLRSQITVTRAGWVRGSGTRRTVFLHDADGFDSFVTSGVGCTFSDIQFEIRTNVISTRNSAFIVINHGECEVYNVNAGQTKLGVVVNANNCRIANLMAAWGTYPGVGSSLVLIKNGTGCTVDGVMSNTSAFGPDWLVHVGGPLQTGTISNTSINNVNHSTPAGSVLIDSQEQWITRGSISKVRVNVFSGTAPANSVKFITARAGAIDDFVVNDVIVNAYALNGIRLEQNSSGVMQDISIDNAIISGSSGNGIEFIRTAGTLREVQVGAAVDVSERAVPFYYSGTVSGFKIAPNALPDVQPGYCYGFTIADDSVAQITLNKSVFTGVLIVTVGSTNYSQLVTRAAPTPAVTTMLASANMATATTVLTGTTGADAKFTVGVLDGVIYLENRLGSSQRVTAVLLTGVV